MRLIEIALFLFCLNLSLGIISSLVVAYPSELGFLASASTNQISYNIDGTSYSADSLAQNMANDMAVKGNEVVGDTSGTGVFSWFNLIWKGLFVMIPRVIGILGGMVTGVASFCTTLGIDATIAWALQVLCWFICGLGLMQWLSGRGFREQW